MTRQKILPCKKMKKFSSKEKRKLLTVLTLMWAIVLSCYPACMASAVSIPSNWEGIKLEILAQIDLSHKTYLNGDALLAKEILSDAYFEKFEAMGMEMMVKKYISSARAYELEKMFGNIRKGMTANNSERVSQGVLDLFEMLEQDAAFLDKKNIPVEGAGYVIPPAALPEVTQENTDSKILKKIAKSVFSPSDVVKEIDLILHEALALYEQGDLRGSKSLVSDAYFDFFEGKGLESLIASKSGNLKSELESKFANILGMIEKGAPIEQVESSMNGLISQLGKIANKLNSSTSVLELFISSFFIIVREGFEAILIISALIAYLRKTENTDKVKIVGMGALTAVVLSIGTALLFLKVYTQSGSSRENLEGITMLIAAAVLFYVSYWLTSKAEAAKWMAYIQNQVIKSIGKGSVLTLGFASFIVVYREGAETILFYSALFSRASGSGGISIWGGFAVGCLFLVGVYYLFEYGTAKIPIRPFFNATSLILYYMAFVFAGEGIVELQIGGLLRATPIDWIPRIGILGIHPTLESVTLQMVMLIAAFIALIYLFVVHPYRAQGRVLQDVSHTLKDLHKLHNKVEHIRAHASSGIRLTASNSGQEIKKISEHLNEIDSSSHELLNHLESLRAELSSLLGNVKNGGNAQKAKKRLV